MIKLLSTQSAKIDKSQNGEWLNRVLYLDPNYNAQVCPYASAGCRKSCLVNSGRMNMPIAQEARRKRTELYFNDNSAFMSQLSDEITKALKQAEKQGKRLAVRLNGTSDMEWSAIYEAFPQVQFYEYTKNPDYKPRHANVHTTFSRHEKHTISDLRRVLRSGTNVAVVFKDNVPQLFHGIPVVDGDKHDRRFEDKEGTIIGLKLKGTNKAKQHAIKRGFAV